MLCLIELRRREDLRVGVRVGEHQGESYFSILIMLISVGKS
jgi:hypothetical protein